MWACGATYVVLNDQLAMDGVTLGLRRQFRGAEEIVTEATSRHLTSQILGFPGKV